MRNTNITIILPPCLKGPGMVKSPPLDIATLAAILKQQTAINLSIADYRKHVIQDEAFYQKQGIDLSVFKDLKRCLRHLLRRDPEINQTVDRILGKTKFQEVDCVVFSVSVLEQFSIALLLASACIARSLKDQFPDIKIVFFGNCPDAHIEKTFRLFKFIDAFPIGGNELYAADYILGRKEGMANGVYYRKNDKIFVPKKIKTMDLNQLPLADFSVLDLESYKSDGTLVLPYELNRGCINKCYFCYFIYKGMMNFRTPRKAVDDMIALSLRYGTDRFHLTDAAINSDTNWLMTFCDLLSQESHKVKWCALATPNISREMLDKLKSAGCVQLRWGVETGSQRLLKKINKGTTTETIRNTLAYAHSIGINNYITLITGLAGEQESDVKETQEFIQEIAAYVDSAQECVYGELGHFPLTVLEPRKTRRTKNRLIRYKNLLEELNIGREDIIEYLSRIETNTVS